MRRRRVPVVLFALLAAVAVVPPGVSVGQAQDDAPAVTLTLDPAAGGSVTGLAVLSPRGGDTAANVLAVGAPAGAIAVIHAGTCAAIDPAPVGLLGDVGTTGQFAATVPVPFATIADGAHVLAFHPGLDLGTTLACGAIPRAAAGPGSSGEPGPGETSEPASARFESATFGFSIDWPAPWQRLDQEPTEGIEGVRLGNGTSQVSIAGKPLAGGDAQGCVRDWQGRLLDLLRTGDIADLAPAAGADGQPIDAGDAQHALGAFQFRLTSGTAAGTTVVEQVECRRLSDAAVLEIASDIPLADRDAQTPLVDALVARLVLTGPPATATSAPTPVTPTAPPSPAPTAQPTTAAGCAGMDAWVRDTLARFDELKRIGEELNTAMSAGMSAYAQALADDSLVIQRLLLEQQGAAVPEAARDIQPDLVTMFQKLAEAYDLMAQAYTTGNTGLLQQGLSTAGEAETLATTTRSAIRRAATPCGITVPAA